MADKPLKTTIRITRIGENEQLAGYIKATEAVYDRTPITVLAHAFKPAVIMIDNDPASRYMVPLHEILKALTTVGLKEKLKGAKHVNTRGN